MPLRSRNGRALKSAPEELKGDREIVMAAVRQSGWALQYAAEEMKGDREVVMAAVAKSGYVLQFATEEMKVRDPKKHGNGSVQANVRADNLKAPHMETWGFEAKKGQNVHPSFAPNITMEFHYHAFWPLRRATMK